MLRLLPLPPLLRPLLSTVGVGLPPLGFLGFLIWFRRSQRYQRDSGLRRRESALRDARRRLRSLKDEGTSEGAELVGEVSACLRTFVGDRLGGSGGALTASEMEKLLSRHALDEPTVRRAREFVDRLEALQYGAGGGMALDRETLLSTLGNLINAIEQGARKVGQR